MLSYSREDTRWWRAATIQGLFILAGLAIVFTVICAFGRPALAQTPQVVEAAPVELVKMFHCKIYNRESVDNCTGIVENQANEWLQKAQPGIRVRDRLLSSTADGLFMAIFYEVREWCATAKPAMQPEKKLPAEATP